jgi:hypothetical protein
MRKLKFLLLADFTHRSKYSKETGADTLRKLLNDEYYYVVLG